MTKEQRDNKKLIHDYALEPELVAECDPFLYRYLTQYKKFGWDTGCVVVQYPSTWRKLVEKLSNDNKRSELLLTSLLRTTKVVRPDSKWNNSFTWLENAEEKNSSHPFHVILARDNPRGQSNVVRVAEISSGTHESKAWDGPPPSVTVERTAASIAACIEPLLRYATCIHFVDPHFRPREPRFQNPLEEFLKIICDGSRDVTLEYHTMHNDRKLSWDLFLSECKQYLPRLIPRGFTLTVRRWEERNVGEELHERYILTDIGGVVIPRGLDESDRYILAEKDRGKIDILRLSFETWQQRLVDYGYDNSKPAFKPEKKPPIVIRGRRNIR